MHYAFYHRTMSLVSWRQMAAQFWIKGFICPPNECVKQRTPLSIAKIWPIIRDILQNVWDGIKLVLFTNRKLHTCFPFVPKVFVFYHLVTTLAFTLFIFTLVKTEKCFEQNNAWYAVVPICLDTV